jgi:hypothetical protein
MRMYVILVIAALLLLGLVILALLFLVGRAVATTRAASKREAVAARLAAVMTQAEQEHRVRNAAAQASAALTSVLPAIQPGERTPRRVA